MRLSLLSAAALLLSACGFRLIGSEALSTPLKNVYIDMVMAYQAAEPPIETALRTKLTRRGAVVVPKAEQADTTLRLSEMEERRETLSIGADGKALEYRLVISVRYELLQGGLVLLPAKTLSVSRDYSFQLSQILQKELEEEQLRVYIQNELAELVLLRIEAGLAVLTAPPEPAQLVSPAH